MTSILHIGSLIWIYGLILSLLIVGIVEVYDKTIGGSNLSFKILCSLGMKYVIPKKGPSAYCITHIKNKEETREGFSKFLKAKIPFTFVKSYYTRNHLIEDVPEDYKPPISAIIKFNDVDAALVRLFWPDLTLYDEPKILEKIKQIKENEKRK